MSALRPNCPHCGAPQLYVDRYRCGTWVLDRQTVRTGFCHDREMEQIEKAVADAPEGNCTHEEDEDGPYTVVIGRVPGHVKKVKLVCGSSTQVSQ